MRAWPQLCSQPVPALLVLLGCREYLVAAINHRKFHLDGIEVEFPVVERGNGAFAAPEQYQEGWNRLAAQLKPSPHLFTNL